MKNCRGIRFEAALASITTAALCLTGCYNFSEARREVRENEEKVRATTEEIQKEIDRKKELEDSTKE